MTTKRTLIAGLLMVIVSGCTGSTTSSSGTSATATSTSASAEPQAVTDELNGGLYDFRPIPDEPSFSVVATGPDGWVGYPSWAMDAPPPRVADAPDGIGISFFTANGLYSDPCRWDVAGNGAADVGDVKVGPTVDDLVGAITENSFYTSTVPRPVTIDGYEGQEVELQLPDDPFTSCDAEPGDDHGHAFVFPGSGLYAQGPANRWHLYILDVDGTRFLSVILSYAGTPQADVDLAESIIESMDIEP